MKFYKAAVLAAMLGNVAVLAQEAAAEEPVAEEPAAEEPAAEEPAAEDTTPQS